MKDWRGIEINVGDTVIWTSGGSRLSVAMGQGTVIALTPKKVKVKPEFGEDRTTAVDRNRVTVVNNIEPAQIETIYDSKIDICKQQIEYYYESLHNLRNGNSSTSSWFTEDVLVERIKNSEEDLQELLSTGP